MMVYVDNINERKRQVALFMSDPVRRRLLDQLEFLYTHARVKFLIRNNGVIETIYDDPMIEKVVSTLHQYEETYYG